MHPASMHPSWCEYPQPSNDQTHTHSAAIGSVHLADDVTVELVLVQTPESVGPMLALHLTAPTSQIGVEITGAQAWELAGVLIDATVARARAEPARPKAREPHTSEHLESPPAGRTRPTWLLDRAKPGPRIRDPRTNGRSFRCPPVRARPDDTNDYGDRPGPTEDG